MKRAPTLTSSESQQVVYLLPRSGLRGVTLWQNMQLGIIDFEPLKQYLVDLATASHASFPTYGGFARLSVPIETDWQADKTGSTGGSSPLGIYKIGSLEDELKVAYKLVTGGKFADALQAFCKILHMSPFLTVETHQQEDDVK